MNNQNKSIILFDGVCNLCNASINFILKNDIDNHFMYASLQSDAAKKQLLHFNKKITDNYHNSILLIDDKIYAKSTAVLHILKKLRFPINLGYVLIVLPKFMRDYLYTVIAKNRYTWFGKRDTCIVPTKEYLNKFLD